MTQIPTVLSFAGHDPGGGAGIQADIEALASQGCHAVTVVTALTVQDTRNVQGFRLLQPEDVDHQARTVLADQPVAAVKTGMLGSAGIVAVVRGILDDYPQLPLVVDPVLASGNRTPLGTGDLAGSIRDLLVPRATVVTPNSIEARRLAPDADTLAACAHDLLAQGAGSVLITGTHEDTPHVINTLYRRHSTPEHFTWERLPHSYHGSGCTLAAAIAGLLAHGMEIFDACHEAQRYTAQTLEHGFRPGQGQHLPDRLFWSRGDA